MLLISFFVVDVINIKICKYSVLMFGIFDDVEIEVEGMLNGK